MKTSSAFVLCLFLALAATCQARGAEAALRPRYVTYKTYCTTRKINDVSSVKVNGADGPVPFYLDATDFGQSLWQSEVGGDCSRCQIPGFVDGGDGRHFDGGSAKRKSYADPNTDPRGVAKEGAVCTQASRTLSGGSNEDIVLAGWTDDLGNFLLCSMYISNPSDAYENSC